MMATNLMKALALLTVLVPSLCMAQNEEYKTAKKSEEKTLFYDDENYGAIKFTYYTF